MLADGDGAQQGSVDAGTTHYGHMETSGDRLRTSDAILTHMHICFLLMLLSLDEILLTVSQT